MDYNEELKQSLEIFNLKEENLKEITEEDIKKIYHKKALLCHPDKTHTNDIQEFQRLISAYEFLQLHKVMMNETDKNTIDSQVSILNIINYFKNKTIFKF